MGAKQTWIITAAAFVLGFADISPSRAVPGFAQVGPGAGAIVDNCAHNKTGNLDEIVAACTVAVKSTAWHGTAWPYLLRASAYNMLGKRDLAFADLDQGIAIARPHDPALFALYNNRCYWHAVANEDLDQALSDCNRALELKPNRARTLDSRAFVEYRQANYSAAIADCNAALVLEPGMASSLYVRGLSKLRSGDATGGNADITAASTSDPKVAATFASFGVEGSH